MAGNKRKKKSATAANAPKTAVDAPKPAPPTATADVSAAEATTATPRKYASIVGAETDGKGTRVDVKREDAVGSTAKDVLLTPTAVKPAAVTPTAVAPAAAAVPTDAQVAPAPPPADVSKEPAAVKHAVVTPAAAPTAAVAPTAQAEVATAPPPADVSKEEPIMWATRLLNDNNARLAFAQETFKTVDFDGPGGINHAEATALVMNTASDMKLKMPSADKVQQLISMCDKSGDGELQAAEFLSFFRAILTTVVKSTLRGTSSSNLCGVEGYFAAWKKSVESAPDAGLESTFAAWKKCVESAPDVGLKATFAEWKRCCAVAPDKDLEATFAAWKTAAAVKESPAVDTKESSRHQAVGSKIALAAATAAAVAAPVAFEGRLSKRSEWFRLYNSRGAKIDATAAKAVLTWSGGSQPGEIILDDTCAVRLVDGVLSVRSPVRAAYFKVDAAGPSLGHWQVALVAAGATARDAAVPPPMQFPNGDSYEGAMRDGHREGAAILRYADGRAEIGVWSAGLPTGDGCRWTNDRSRAFRLLDGALQAEVTLHEGRVLAATLGLPVPP